MLTTEQLKALDFVEKTYAGQEGVFLVKQRKVEDFPYARAHLIDHEYISGLDEAFLEICPNGTIQFFIPASEYTEGPYELSSPEGQGLMQEGIDSK